MRDRDVIARDLLGVLGLAAFALGLGWLRGSEALGFDPGGALDGVLSQLSFTLVSGLLVLLATGFELAAGLVLARAARRRPFDSIAEALLASMVAAVLKDTLLLGALAGFGLFQAPILISVDVVLILAARYAGPVAEHVRPVVELPTPREALDSVQSWTVAALVAVVWAGPIVLQLASPVVPFIDVLPNYVGPVEHLRTFGWFEPLTATQSPIIGPSRTVLGYDGLLGSIAVMTGLPGGVAIAGFILPQAILVAAGAYRLASAIRHGDPPVWAWALLAFALSQPFARLADARGTVVVTPLVCLGLAVAAELLDRDGGDPWRIGRGAVIGLALGAAILVHPVIGFFAVATLAIVTLAHPREAAPDAAVAGVTATLIALPQLATMTGRSLPTIALGIALPVAIALALVAGRFVARSDGARAALVRLARLVRIPIALAAVGGVAGAFAVGYLQAERLNDATAYTRDLVLDSSRLLLAVTVAGALLGSRGARSAIVWAGAAVGVAAVLLTQVLPGDIGFLGDALRYEVPKTVHYWLSMLAAAGAGAALAFAWSAEHVAERAVVGLPLPWLARVVGLAWFMVVAALPWRDEPIDAYHLGEHRWSETFAIDLRFADTGFWRGFPDSRFVIDGPRAQLVEAVRTEIAAGRLRHDTPVLHIASTFQQWASTPLGVFAGVFETFLSEDPEVSHQTVGGRLFDIADLDTYLDPARYPYVVLEPKDLDPSMRDRIAASGYGSIFANEQGEVFRAASAVP